MLHNRQAPGRDFHKHFSLVPARSDTNPPSNPQSAPAPSPLQDRAQARNATSRAPHLSLIPLAPPAPPRLRPPTPAPLPPLSPPSPSSLHSTKGRLERHPRGREGPGSCRRGTQGTPSPQPQRHPPRPLRPCSALVLSDCRTPDPCLCPESLPSHGQGAPTLALASVRATCLRAPRVLLAPVATT